MARARVMTGYQYLVERHLRQDVVSWIEERWRQGKSWNQMAKEMTADLEYPEGIKMSRTLLQKWYKATTGKASPSAPEGDQ